MHHGCIMDVSWMHQMAQAHGDRINIHNERWKNRSEQSGGTLANNSVIEFQHAVDDMKTEIAIYRRQFESGMMKRWM